VYCVKWRNGLCLDFFVICKDNSKAVCILCTVISRGSASAKSYTTTVLNKHQAYKHPQEFKEVVNVRTAGAASKCTATKAIRIRPNSLKTLFGTPLKLTLLSMPTLNINMVMKL